MLRSLLRRAPRASILPGLAIAALLALPGCVAFEHAPAQAQCDPELPGTWLLEEGPTTKTVRVDARCHTEDWPNPREESVALDLTGFRIGEDRYLMFDPAAAQRAIGAEGESLTRTAPPGSVFLVRYRIQGDVIDAWLADPQPALAGIAAGKLQGRRLEDHFALLGGSPEQLRTLLSEHGEVFYGTGQKSLKLRRAAANQEAR